MGHIQRFRSVPGRFKLQLVTRPDPIPKSHTEESPLSSQASLVYGVALFQYQIPSGVQVSHFRSRHARNDPPGETSTRRLFGTSPCASTTLHACLGV